MDAVVPPAILTVWYVRYCASAITGYETSEHASTAGVGNLPSSKGHLGIYNIIIQNYQLQLLACSLLSNRSFTEVCEHFCNAQYNFIIHKGNFR